jgi:hypothetical protein
MLSLKYFYEKGHEIFLKGSLYIQRQEYVHMSITQLVGTMHYNMHGAEVRTTDTSLIT